MISAFLIASLGYVSGHSHCDFDAAHSTIVAMTSKEHEQERGQTINPAFGLIDYLIESWICGKQAISAESFSAVAELMRNRAAIVDAENHDYVLPFRLPVAIAYNKDGDLERFYLHKDRVINRLKHSSAMRRLAGTWTCTSLTVMMLGPFPVPLVEPMPKMSFVNDICLTASPLVIPFLTVFSSATERSVDISLRYPDSEGDRVLRERLGQPLDFRVWFLSDDKCFVQSRSATVTQPGEVGWILAKTK